MVQRAYRGLRPSRGGALAPALGAGRAQTETQAFRSCKTNYLPLSFKMMLMKANIQTTRSSSPSAVANADNVMLTSAYLVDGFILESSNNRATSSRRSPLRFTHPRIAECTNRIRRITNPAQDLIRGLTTSTQRSRVKPGTGVLSQLRRA